MVFLDHNFDPLASCFFPFRGTLMFKMKYPTAVFLAIPTELRMITEIPIGV